MTKDARQERWRQQIAMLLAYPGVGALTAGAVAANIGAPPDEIGPILDTMVRDGHLARDAEGRFAVPSPTDARAG